MKPFTQRYKFIMPQPFSNAARKMVFGDELHRITVKPLVASSPLARDFKMRFSGNPGFQPLNLGLQTVEFLVNRFDERILIKSFAGTGFKNPRRDQVRLATTFVEFSSPRWNLSKFNESLFKHRVPQTPCKINVPIMTQFGGLSTGLRHVLVNA